MPSLDARVDELFDKLKVKLDELISANINLLKSAYDNRFSAIETSIADLAVRCDTLATQLESRLHQLTPSEPNGSAQPDRSKNLMCYGIPAGENLDLAAIVSKICLQFDPQFDANSMACFRLNSANGLKPPVIIKFATKRARDAVFFTYIKKRDLMLSSVLDGVDIQGRVYLNEHLTKEEAAVVKKCRELKVAN